MKDVTQKSAGQMRTLRFKVKSESYGWLNRAAVEVNQVWNWANETSMDAADRNRRAQPKWLSWFDLNKLSAGAAKYFEQIHAEAIERVNGEYVTRRRAAKLSKLRWRVSHGARRSLGWVPFKSANLKRHGNALRFAGKTFRVFESSRLDGMTWKQGCFAQDACGDWWLCLPVEVSVTQDVAPLEAVGIDLGLKAVATTSDGESLEAARFYRDSEQKIAQAQRRGHKRQAKRLYRHAANRRKDAMHKFSRRIVNRYQQIIVGDVSSTTLVKTRMAKSVLDAGWGMLKNFLDYKSQQAARSFSVVSERNTTRVCSNCGCVSGPSGLRQLAVRQWECAECGSAHDRDVNAARNILTAGSRCRTSMRGNELSPQIEVAA